MTTTTTIAQQYVDAFNESDRDARRSLLACTFTGDATYVDPVMSGEGLDGLDAMIGGVRAQFPGHAYRLTGKVDGYGDRLRFAWELAAPGLEQPFIVGTDFVLLAGDGRLRTVTGFLDLMPAAEQSPLGVVCQHPTLGTRLPNTGKWRRSASAGTPSLVGQFGSSLSQFAVDGLVVEEGVDLPPAGQAVHRTGLGGGEGAGGSGEAQVVHGRRTRKSSKEIQRRCRIGAEVFVVGVRGRPRVAPPGRREPRS